MSALTLDRRTPSPTKSFKSDSRELGYNVVSLAEIPDAEKSEWKHYVTTPKAHGYVLMSYNVSPLHFNILEKSFFLDRKFKGLYDEVIASKKYLEYEDDWDDEHAVGCDPQIYLRTIELLLGYAEYVFKFYDIIVKAPSINLLTDGSFDIEWRCTHRTLLMNVVNSEKFDIHFYGKDLNTTVLKGFLFDLEINRELSHWMQGLI